MSKERKIILCDVDGTLTKDICWTEDECRKAKPRKDVIAKVNELHKTCFIFIYTARREDFMTVTVEWLRENGVKFHGWMFGKVPADLYLDDHAITPEELCSKN